MAFSLRNLTMFCSVGAIVGTVAACASDSHDLRGPQVHQYDDTATVLIAGTSEGGQDARLSGTLVLGPGGCVGVDVGGRTIPVVFGNYTVRDTTKFLVFVNDDGYELGDRVTLFGGSAGPPYPTRVPDPPPACTRAEDELFIANGN